MVSADVFDGEEKRSVRWPLVGAALAFGCLVLFSGWLIAYSFTSLENEHAAFWSGLLVNMGTTILLATALVWFERAIVRNVKKQTKLAVANAVSDVAAEAASQASQALVGRLEELEQQFKERAGADAVARTAAAKVVGEVPDFASVYEALGKARALNAIGSPRYETPTPEGGEIVVPAGEGDDAPLVAITILDGVSAIYLGHVVDRTYGAAVVWTQDNDVVEIASTLSDRMIAENHGALAKRVSLIPFFSNISRVLSDATDGRTHSDERWLSGAPVVEMVNEDCYLSTSGIEVRGAGVVASSSNFGRYTTPIGREVTGEDVPALPPAGLRVEAWNRALARGRRYFRQPSFITHYPQPPEHSSYVGR